ncbi:TetR/AcrR family transcriptional regulator [Oerskovia sp. NPDC057915]|uniref:TetR/AcrR family transcriptional regulator n=1 Tax=Oerskovia sp. NPDC057915 TaxID=3346280 RepID=UPI0036DF8A08
MSDTDLPSRERLVRAARDLFWAQGVEGTSPRQVLAASGVGQGSLYHHFPTKHDLSLAAISATTHEALASVAADLEDADRSPTERLVAYLERPRPALAGCKVGRLTSDPSVMSDEELRGPVRDYFAGLVTRVRAVFEESGLPDDAAHDRAYAAVAIVQGGYVLARALDDPAAMSAAVEGFVSMLEPAPDPSTAARR